MIGETLYVAPALDLSDNPRPHVSDGFVDIGALESKWPLQLLPVADLATIYFGTQIVEPAFQREVLNYEIDIPDTCTSVASSLIALPVDKLAEVVVEEPDDLLSESDADRTTTITVYSSDQSTQKSYSVLFHLLSVDASLSSLDISIGKLEPSFDPHQLSYVDTLPYGTTETPEVTCTATNENASVEVIPATDVTSSFISDQRTTKIIVIAEMGTPSITYEIEFVVAAEQGVSIPAADFTPVVHLYPNPFSTSACLEIRNIERIKGIQLVNMTGQVVRNINYTEGEATIIERKGLPVGLYFLRIQSNYTIIKKVLLE
jgi:hypothetical protein